MSHIGFKNRAAEIALTCWVAMVAVAIKAEPAVSRKFNGPETTWQLLGTGVPAKILAQACTAGGARDNSGFERIEVAAPAGQSALLVCPIRPIAVLDELQVRLWVNANRPDVQLAARVTLPRSLDPQRRTPATAIVRGSIYNRPGHWQELRLAEVPKLLADQIRVMRATPGASIDSHEAFVDAVVLVVPGNPSGVEVGTDDLQVDGVVLSSIAAGLSVGNPSGDGRRSTPDLAQRTDIRNTRDAASIANTAVAAAKTSPVRLQGTTLVVDGRPLLPRVIQWNGEPLQFLSNCGFNVVQLPALPTAEQSADAERYGLWFLSPPDHPDALAHTEIGRVGDRILAWYLKDEALEVDPNYAIRWAELVREHDAVFGRPIVIMPDSNWSAVSKAADILIAWNARMGLLSATDFDTWLSGCPQKALPGTPLWVCLATKFDGKVREQVNALRQADGASLPVDGGQLESMVRIACAHGTRGFVFQSTSSLSETDEPTRRRVAHLRLVNQRLQLIEPWLAGGKMVERIDSSDGLHSSIMLHVDRARLLIQIANENVAQVHITNQPTRAPSNEIVYTVPGVPESTQVFYLLPAAMRAVLSQRIAGGTKISLPAGGDGFVLMTEDPQVIYSLRQRVARDGVKTVQLERDLAAQQALAFAATGQRLVQLGYNSDLATREIGTINQQLAQLDGLLASGQIEQSHELAAVVMEKINRATAEQRRAIGGPIVLASNPLAVSFETFVEFADLQRSLASMHGGENLMVGGDFENLAQMTQLGWQHLSHRAPNVETSAQLSTVEPQQGTYCLELSAVGQSATQQQPVAGNLVWIVSPPIAASPNQIIEITGWVRVDKPFAGGDGLEIRDSLGGPALAIVVDQTSGWQPFRMIRAATAATELRLTFSLAGLGSAQVDAVMVRALGQSVAQRLPAVQPIGSFPAANPFGTTGPRFAAPQTR